MHAAEGMRNREAPTHFPSGLLNNAPDGGGGEGGGGGVGSNEERDCFVMTDEGGLC